MGAGSICTLVCVAVQMARLAASRSARETLCIYGFDDVETSVSQCDVAIVCHSRQIRYVCDQDSQMCWIHH